MSIQNSDEQVRTVGVVGVGRMGGPMARNLLRAEFQVIAYDTASALVAALEAEGARGAASVAALASAAEAVIMMLPSDDALQQVVAGPGGLLDTLQPGQVLIDMSTSKLATSQRLAGLLAARGIAMLDAPVSGGEKGAQDATLSIMVGGEAAAFARARPLLKAMGTTVTHIGGSGMGLVAKFVNQMIMEAEFCVIAESFALAAKAGADLTAVYAAVGGGLAGSKVLDQMVPHMLSGEYGSGRELTLHHKDGAYALAAAESVGAWVPVTELSHQLLDQALQAGHGGGAASAVARLYEAKMGISLVPQAPAGESESSG